MGLGWSLGGQEDEILIGRKGARDFVSLAYTFLYTNGKNTTRFYRTATNT
jgi:hypothetical protein